MRFPCLRREGDRLQQLRAVLPCEVQVIAETHPLFGRLLAARSFKRWNGVLMLVVDLRSVPEVRSALTQPLLAAVIEAFGLRSLEVTGRGLQLVPYLSGLDVGEPI